MLHGVGLTALGVAMVRALESERADRLFDDPYARAFLEALPGVFPTPDTVSGPMARLGAAFSASGVLRTRFFDDYLLGAGLGQVVLLAAGLDTRAYRLAWPPGTRVFEVDLPDVLEFKDSVLASAAPRCERTAVPANLRGPWTRDLAASGFSPDEPAAWLAEGLLVYLTAEEVAGLFTGIGELSAPGSALSFETGGRLLDRARRVPGMRAVRELWKGGIEDPAGWLAGHGWEVGFHPAAAYSESVGRPLEAGGDEGFVVASPSPPACGPSSP